MKHITPSWPASCLCPKAFRQECLCHHSDQSVPPSPPPGQPNRASVNSPHNLSASGPGSIRASNETEVCIFCHTPHNATPVSPLWNRNLPTSRLHAFTPATRSHAVPGQPTGSSKLCLSCHDGTIALGSVLSRQQRIAMAGGITTLPPGDVESRYRPVRRSPDQLPL